MTEKFSKGRHTLKRTARQKLKALVCKSGQREVMFLLKTIHSCEKEAGEFLLEIAASWQKAGLARFCQTQ